MVIAEQSLKEYGDAVGHVRVNWYVWLVPCTMKLIHSRTPCNNSPYAKIIHRTQSEVIWAPSNYSRAPFTPQTMSNTHPAISALVFGLDTICGEKYNTRKVDLDKLFRDLRTSEDVLHRTPGVNSRFFYMDIDNPTDIEALKKAIQEGDKDHDFRPWDTICIGFGVRGNPDLTPQFEELINYAKNAAPAARLTFTSTPTGHLETFKRWFPHVGKEE